MLQAHPRMLSDHDQGASLPDPLGKEMVFKLVHPVKIDTPRLVMLVGMVTLVRLVIPANA